MKDIRIRVQIKGSATDLVFLYFIKLADPLISFLFFLVYTLTLNITFFGQNRFVRVGSHPIILLASEPGFIAAS